ncbi:hypothetical protein FHR99_002533 [Litorivivens lipolytica]|uniref:DUF1513 domain-containing protein n=1 Tax=Litorivivens lipolytica TaxID=1524264 RepID=A0A7W4Z684_9GAMM|nr:DUF1513 domain-containing protein [Litorivivens lipolytica]MBB3048259.1 hypothetical protein [Litorivivens lipolytica]
MTATEFSRRQILGGCLAGLALSLTGTVAAGSKRRIYSAASDRNNRHFLCCWAEGELQFKVASSGRGHDVLLNVHTNSALYFARRPGTWLTVLDAHSGELQASVTSPAGRHFYGHGTLIQQGEILLTSENDFANGGQGVIGIYDCRDNYRRIGEFASGGIGPHQIATMPNGRTLVVANGGILTLPGSNRDKLNLDSMQPNLSYIDSRTGQLLGQYQPPHPQLSLRHLDVNNAGEVTVGAQFEGDTAQTLPLLFRHWGEDTLQPLSASDTVWRSHNHYIASVASAGDTVIATSPRGNCISRWRNGQFEKLEHLNDVAGVAFDPQRNAFVTSNGRGQLVHVDQQGLSLTGRVADLRWDNHMELST